MREIPYVFDSEAFEEVGHNRSTSPRLALTALDHSKGRLFWDPIYSTYRIIAVLTFVSPSFRTLKYFSKGRLSLRLALVPPPFSQEHMKFEK